MCRRLHGRVGSGGDEFPTHDLMGAFIEGGPITIHFGERADIGTHGFQHVAIRNDADQPAVLCDKQVMEMELIEQVAHSRERIVHGHGHNSLCHDGAHGRLIDCARG